MFAPGGDSTKPSPVQRPSAFATASSRSYLTDESPSSRRRASYLSRTALYGWTRSQYRAARLRRDSTSSKSKAMACPKSSRVMVMSFTTDTSCFPSRSSRSVSSVRPAAASSGGYGCEVHVGVGAVVAGGPGTLPV